MNGKEILTRIGNGLALVILQVIVFLYLMPYFSQQGYITAAGVVVVTVLIMYLRQTINFIIGIAILYLLLLILIILSTDSLSIFLTLFGLVHLGLTITGLIIGGLILIIKSAVLRENENTI